MNLFFDCETTGKALMRAGPEHPAQPRIVQFAALLTDDDGTERGGISLIVKPDGWEIPQEASGIHGITTELAAAVGVPIVMVLGTFSSLCAQASTLIAHNIDFDLLVTLSEYHRIKKADRTGGAMVHFCTMRAMTPICKLPGSYGDYKWPKLIEAHQHLFGQGFDSAHDAMADVRACARVYFEYLKRQSTSEVSV